LLNLDSLKNEKISGLNLSPQDSLNNSQLNGPLTITPSNMVMGSIPNISTVMAGPFTSTAKTPVGLLSSKVDQSKLYTPVAYSPINGSKNTSLSKNKKGYFGKLSPKNSNNKVDEVAYFPGMLRISPNSGFT
jgi:hypothetical protein